MKLKPAINNTKYVKSSQCRFRATLPSATKVPATFPFAARTASRSRYALVSGKQKRKMMIKTGGQAPNLCKVGISILHTGFGV